MPQSTLWGCMPKRLLLQIIDGLILVFLIIIQGSVLNYYVIQQYRDSVSSYFFFIADFICVFAFIGTLAEAYNRFKKFHPPDECDYPDWRNKRRRLTQHTKIGFLPLSYTSWLFYTIILVTKICVIFKSGLAGGLDREAHFGPQLLQVTLASASFVFLLLVEGHNWAKRGTPRYAFVTTTCAKTSMEIFDSVSFLTVLTSHGPKDLSETTKDAILILSAINFFLPSVALYRLSASDFAMSNQSIPLTVLYYLLHLCLVDVPFMVVRLYLWIALRERASMFLMKNILSIVLTLRGMYPDLVELKGDIVPCSSKSRQPKTQVEEESLKTIEKPECET